MNHARLTVRDAQAVTNVKNVFPLLSYWIIHVLIFAQQDLLKLRRNASHAQTIVKYAQTQTHVQDALSHSPYMKIDAKKSVRRVNTLTMDNVNHAVTTVDHVTLLTSALIARNLISIKMEFVF